MSNFVLNDFDVRKCANGWAIHPSRGYSTGQLIDWADFVYVFRTKEELADFIRANAGESAPKEKA